MPKSINKTGSSTKLGSGRKSTRRKEKKDSKRKNTSKAASNKHTPQRHEFKKTAGMVKTSKGTQDNPLDQTQMSQLDSLTFPPRSKIVTLPPPASSMTAEVKSQQSTVPFNTASTPKVHQTNDKILYTSNEATSSVPARPPSMVGQVQSPVKQQAPAVDGQACAKLPQSKTPVVHRVNELDRTNYSEIAPSLRCGDDDLSKILNEPMKIREYSNEEAKKTAKARAEVYSKPENQVVLPKSAFVTGELPPLKPQTVRFAAVPIVEEDDRSVSLRRPESKHNQRRRKNRTAARRSSDDLIGSSPDPLFKRPQPGDTPAPNQAPSPGACSSSPSGHSDSPPHNTEERKLGFFGRLKQRIWSRKKHQQPQQQDQQQVVTKGVKTEKRAKDVILRGPVRDNVTAPFKTMPIDDADLLAEMAKQGITVDYPGCMQPSPPVQPQKHPYPTVQMGAKRSTSGLSIDVQTDNTQDKSKGIKTSQRSQGRRMSRQASRCSLKRVSSKHRGSG